MDKKEEKIIYKYMWHIGIITIIFILLSFEMRSLGGFEKIFSFSQNKYIVTTIIIWISQYLIIKGITNKSRLSVAIVVGTEATFDIINYLVKAVRGSTIAISDLYAIKTAISVSKSISIELDSRFWIGLLIVFTICSILIFFKEKIIESKHGYKYRVLEIFTGLLVIIIISKTNIYRGWSLWDLNNTYQSIGTPMTILRMAQDMKVRPPSGYNKIDAENVLKKYEEYNSVQQEDTPNIIVIVNESFCDYFNLYKDGYADPIEYYTNLSKSENVISGTMLASEFGGRTSNIEYEFLTQNSTRILSNGSYVFQQYITRKDKTNLVEHLKKMGYKTSAIHPWESYAYSRNKVYPLLGFDEIKFKDDIEGLEKNFNNDFYTDRSTYNELFKQINNKKKNEKIFKYVLTVQNHIGYLNTDPKQIDYNDDFHTNVYMQLIHESAEAFKEVIEKLKREDEKYIVLFFGDHQPNLDDSDNSIEREAIQYETPFLIWANYDIQEQYNIRTSTIYLQNYLLKSAGIQFSAMNNYMESLQKYYPVITKRFYEDNYGMIYRENNDKSSNYEKIEEYDKIVYYRIFDEK